MVNFQEVSRYHKSLANLTKYLLENDEENQEKIKQASEVLNARICELYKRGPIRI